MKRPAFKPPHPWKPGTMVKTCEKDVPLFKSPKAYNSFAFVKIPINQWVMYTDCEGDSVARMVKVVHGEQIGWTYLDAVYKP